MSNDNHEIKALATVSNDLAPTKFPGINRGQLELLKRTIAKGTTDDEFALFMNTAQRLKLDPFAKQIYAVKRYDSATKTEVMATQVAIDGYRAVAEDTGQYDGREGPFWCGEDEIWKEVWVSIKPPSAAKVVVYRKGVARPYVGVAIYKSYVQKNREGGPRATWATMPDVMLAKCAEAQALRAAFPKQLSGTRTEDEMDQADNAEPEAMAALPNMKRADAAPAIIDATPAKTGPPAFDFPLAIATANTVDELVSVGKRIAAELAEAERARMKPSYEARLAILRGPDPFAAFLVDLGGMLGIDASGWTADDAGIEFVDQLSRRNTLEEVNAAALPWLAVASKPGRGQAVRAVRKMIEKAAEDRRAELRAGAAT